MVISVMAIAEPGFGADGASKIQRLDAPAPAIIRDGLLKLVKGASHFTMVARLPLHRSGGQSLVMGTFVAQHSNTEYTCGFIFTGTSSAGSGVEGGLPCRTLKCHAVCLQEVLVYPPGPPEFSAGKRGSWAVVGTVPARTTSVELILRDHTKREIHLLPRSRYLAGRRIVLVQLARIPADEAVARRRSEPVGMVALS